jgi:hypothetical protein
MVYLKTLQLSLILLSVLWLDAAKKTTNACLRLRAPYIALHI